MLADLFPSHNFVLYDPEVFYEKIELSKNIEVHHKLLLEDDAIKDEYKGCLLISDIRTVDKECSDISNITMNLSKALTINREKLFEFKDLLDYETNKKLEKILTKINFIDRQKMFSIRICLNNFIEQCLLSEKISINDIKSLCEDLRFVNQNNVLEDNELQYKFINWMKPKMSMLKFKVPYPQKNEDCLYYNFLDGKCLLQAYAPVTSTEMRLITDGTSLKEYNCNQIEKRLFYFNVIMRNEENFDNIQEDAILRNFIVKNPQYSDIDIKMLLDFITKEPLKFNQFLQ